MRRGPQRHACHSLRVLRLSQWVNEPPVPRGTAGPGGVGARQPGQLIPRCLRIGRNVGAARAMIGNKEPWATTARLAVSERLAALWRQTQATEPDADAISEALDETQPADYDE
jgi:hypothetical protein